MKTKRNLSGVYFRVEMEPNKWQNYCIEDLPEDKIDWILQQHDKEWLINLVKILCNTINEIGENFNIEKQ